MAGKYGSKTLDHLGIVAGVCEKIRLIKQIDARIPDTGRTVTVGQAVQAMVLNGLGFVGRPLYLTPEFYRTKPLDVLIGAGIEAEDLNSDSLGKALDYVHQAGITELFAEISAHALKTYGIEVRFAHLDTTAFSLEGAYEVDPETDDDEPQPIKITYGYSKDHRPDLKQAILGLISVNRTSIPAYLSAVSGNVSDKTSMPEMAEVYLKQFGADEHAPVLVADTALYSAETLEDLSNNQWVTRVPATLTEAKAALVSSPRDEMVKSERPGYRYREMTSEYGGVEQRWLVVYSEGRAQQEQTQLERQIEREQEKIGKQIKKLSRQRFNCEADADQALVKANRGWKFHRLTGSSQAHTRYAQAGRPTQDSETITDWQLEVDLERDEEKIRMRTDALGKYILATNLLDPQELPAEELLTVYKDQNRSVERGFRFLKDPFFFTSSFFLKKPSRIMGLLMVMGLSLLIYALAEHHLRQQLVETGQSIPDQKGKPTQNPTMRRVFQMFEGIHLLTIEEDDRIRRILTNVGDVHLQIATLLGAAILKFYVFEDAPL